MLIHLDQCMLHLLNECWKLKQNAKDIKGCNEIYYTEFFPYYFIMQMKSGLSLLYLEIRAGENV